MTRQPRHENGHPGTKGPRGRPSKLGRLVGRGRPPLTYRVTQVLTGLALPPLRCERGFGAAHVGVLSGVGAAAPRPHRGNRMGPLAAGDPRGTVGEREREEGRHLLL